MATRKHKFQTTFAGGVLSENAFGRIDTTLYNNGLKQGENIIIENPGGATRRPGTLFVREFEEDYVRLLPFSFNTQQTYLLAFTELKIEIFRDDVIVASLVSPYTADQVKELDFAQSADSMVLTQADHPVQILRRLATDADWELIPAPFVVPPAEWGTLNGYPKYCTFFQGRLYLAACNLLPQNVWGSQVHDFFNFDPGTGLDAEAIYDILDTDFINPIVAIYAEKALYVFSTGDEFINNAKVITPAASAWQRASKYGSFGTVRPVAFDAGVVYLDRSGRTIRQMIFEDSIKAFDSAAVSMFSEDLIKAPINMGVMKGQLFQASNFLFLVNVDGTMAVLNLSRAAGMAAWVKWTTQGAFKDLLTFNNEITYILVERRGKWILEKLQNGIYVDSGATKTTNLELLIPEPVTYLGEDVTYLGTTVTYGFTPTSGLNSDAVIGDRDNFYGVSYDSRGYGRVVIVISGSVYHKEEQFIREPLKPSAKFGNVVVPINAFAQDTQLQDLYFQEVEQTEFYLYSLLITTEVDYSQSFIDGLPHLIGREVVMNLDGSVFLEQTVIPGDEIPGGGLLKSYPDGTDWLFNETPGSETYILRYLDDNLVTTLIEGFYQGTKYGPLTENEFWNAYPITQSGTPVAGDEFLEEGVFVSEQDLGTSKIFTADGTFIAPMITSVDVCMVGGGGSGNVQFQSRSYGGKAGQVITATGSSVEFGVSYPVVVGDGGAATTTNTGNNGSSSTFNGLTADGGQAAPDSLYSGDGASKTSCGGTAVDGSRYDASANFGGESSGFGDGGDATPSGTGETAGVGSGSGGNGSSGSTGAGGRGEVRLTFKQTYTKKYKIRKMQLLTAVVPSTDGVVITPRSFATGQAGLWFGVNMETLPFNGASLTNEPKRVVSVMPRFVKTAGLNIANNEVPERQFGLARFNEAPPQRSGIQKIRLLGYTRETTIRITQYDPLPMTLVSLDIEINIG